nr:MAG TPA: protein of unknown function (DUF4314) [Caudoviricetes sp.]
MIFPSKEIVEQVHRQYPVGTRVELVKMDDIQAPPIGTKGIVEGVDDTASLLVAWDNGSHLNVIYGEDEVRKIQQADNRYTQDAAENIV